MGNIIQPLWADCPALTRTVCVGLPAMSVLQTVMGFTPFAWIIPEAVLCNVESVKHLHVWTPFLSMFAVNMLGDGMSFLMGLFQIYMVMTQFPAKEKEIGSTTFAMWMLVVNAMIAAIFLSVMLLISSFSQMPIMYTMNPISGFWPLVLTVLTLRLLSDPNGSTSFWGLVNIPNKLYPLALVGFFSLINGMRIQWDFLSAVALGYMYVQFNLDRFTPAPVHGAKVEQKFSCCRGGRGTFLGGAWVPSASTAGYGSDASDRRYAVLNDFGRTSGQTLTANSSNSAQQASNGAGFQVFSGHGKQLGDGRGEAKQEPAPPTQLTQMNPQENPQQAPPVAAADLEANNQQ